MSLNISSDKLILRAPEPSDADFMYDVENDREAWAYSDTVAPLSRKILRDYALSYDADPFSARQLRLVITSISGDPIGIADLYELSPLHRNAFVGIYVLPVFRGKGLAAEALTLLAEYASRNLGLKVLGARIPESNLPSASAFNKAGFNLTASLPGWLSQPGDKRESLLVYTLAL